MGLESSIPGAASFAVTGAASNDFIWNNGCTTCVRNGAGDYTATLTVAIDVAQTLIIAQILSGAGNANIQVAKTSTVLLAITTFVIAAATNESFQILIIPVQT